MTDNFGEAAVLFACGVAWYVWSQYGLAWALLYGIFWPAWLGFHAAAYILR